MPPPDTPGPAVGFVSPALRTRNRTPRSPPEMLAGLPYRARTLRSRRPLFKPPRRPPGTLSSPPQPPPHPSHHCAAPPCRNRAPRCRGHVAPLPPSPTGATQRPRLEARSDPETSSLDPGPRHRRNRALSTAGEQATRQQLLTAGAAPAALTHLPRSQIDHEASRVIQELGDALHHPGPRAPPATHRRSTTPTPLHGLPVRPAPSMSYTLTP